MLIQQPDNKRRQRLLGFPLKRKKGEEKKNSFEMKFAMDRGSNVVNDPEQLGPCFPTGERQRCKKFISVQKTRSRVTHFKLTVFRKQRDKTFCTREGRKGRGM